jgi:hypothetical protein
MRKQGDNYCVTLLLPPEKFEFKVYRNGQVTQHTTLSLDLSRSLIEPW